MVNMKILDLPLKAKWYEMIESGNKKEEYREIKKYWIGRLAKCGGHYVNMVRFLTVHIATMYGSAWMVISMICTKVIRFTLQ